MNPQKAQNHSEESNAELINQKVVPTEVKTPHTFQTLTELKKGCGDVEYINDFGERAECGLVWGKKGRSKIILCDKCQAKLTQTEALLEKIEKALNKMKEEYLKDDEFTNPHNIIEQLKKEIIGE